MIKINKWNETFENSDSRKRQRLKCFFSPSGCDSMGYIELMVMNGDAGLMAFGVFQALCQYAATQPAERRGMFCRSSGEAQTISQLSSILKISKNRLEESLILLSSKDVDWITIENRDRLSDKSADQVAEICRSGGRNLPVNRQKSADQVAEICRSGGSGVEMNTIGEVENNGERMHFRTLSENSVTQLIYKELDKSADNLPVLCREKEKEKEKEGLSCTNTREAESLNFRVARVVPKIKALLPAWSNLTIRETSYEWREIGAQVEHWENYDFDLVRSYFASDADDGFKQTKLRTFLEDWGAGMLGKAHEWKKPKAKAKEQAKAKTEKPTRELWQVQKEIASAEGELTAIIQNLRNWHHVQNPNPGPGKAATIKVLKSGPELDRIRLENYISKLKQEKAILTQ
jgi:hypothetical protein